MSLSRGNARATRRFDDGGTVGSPRATNSTIRARSSPFSRALLLSPSHGLRAVLVALSRRPPLASSRCSLVARRCLAADDGGRGEDGTRDTYTQDSRGFTIRRASSPARATTNDLPAIYRRVAVRNPRSIAEFNAPYE